MNNGLAAGLRRSHWDLLVSSLWADIIIIIIVIIIIIMVCNNSHRGGGCTMDNEVE